MDSAVEAVYQDIELFGADRSSVYDTGYLSARNRRLRDQGWEVIM